MSLFECNISENYAEGLKTVKWTVMIIMTPIWTTHPIMMTLPHQIIIFLAANSAILRSGNGFS